VVGVELRSHEGKRARALDFRLAGEKEDKINNNTCRIRKKGREISIFRRKRKGRAVRDARLGKKAVSTTKILIRRNLFFALPKWKTDRGVRGKKGADITELAAGVLSHAVELLKNRSSEGPERKKGEK